MHILFKLLYLVLFCSIDILLYLTLSRNIVNARIWLIIDVIIWLIVFVFHLPAFGLPYLMRFKAFIQLSAMIVQLTFAYYVGVFAMRKIENSILPDEVKGGLNMWLNFVFKNALFFIILLFHFLFIAILFR